MLPASVALCALAILLLPAGAASHRAASPSALGELSVVSHRPAASTWRRTQCGSPSGDADIPTRWASEVSADTTPLPAYPRPQMVRGRGGDRDKGDPSLWSNLNGLWEWEPAADAAPPFGRPLNGSILVPFPVESCLSGVAPASSATLVAQMWYRLVFDAAVADGAKTLLHFGAVDWQATVYLNGLLLRHDGRLGNHTGGYDGFGFDVTDRLKHAGNELLVHVLDPSDAGAQPNGKQRVSAVDRPGGDTYTPSSGIWQTVWMEAVPPSYISTLKIDQASTTNVKVTAFVEGGGATTPVRFEVVDRDGTTVAEAAGAAGSEVSIFVARATAWSPSEPYLYDLKVSTPTDAVTSYFGLRTFALGDGPKGRRPLLNGNFTFLAGFLDQSWWPDGQYTAPTDEALAFDVEAVATFGLNMIRLHQKVNPERWYWHADRLGVVVFQDMVQKYGRASKATVPLFVSDAAAMVHGRRNHPSILQWTAFNEGDCWEVFDTPPHDVAGVVALFKRLDPTRLVDTDSGGRANDRHIADVNDIHSYPFPHDARPSGTQYAMVGEFGGIGAFVRGKEWKPQACHTYLKVGTPQQGAAAYVKMAATLRSRVDHVSASVYTQTTDVELECDGFLNYDRTSKFSDEDTAAIRKANQAIIAASRARGVEGGAGTAA
mmetsp:Transcript_22705/g.64653  ORF Transcript_22705/g.64653 Transcript_22705/m.64653 type:complete len:659 (-) Transcript_22705:221-2197(-)